MNKFSLMVAMFVVVLVSGCANQTPVRYTQNSNAQQPNQSYTNRTFREEANCTIAGEDFGNITHEQCLRNRKTRTISEPAKTEFKVIQTGVKVSNLENLWKWRAEGASDNTPKLCVVERITREQKPAFCSELRELVREKGETRDNWKVRASRM